MLGVSDSMAARSLMTANLTIGRIKEKSNF